jgi:hypothetical protein
MGSEMTRRIALASLLVGSLLICGHPGASTPAAAQAPVARTGKLVAPIEIELLPLARRKGDGSGQRRFRVRVTPRVDAPRLEVKVTLPSGVALVRGETRWQGPARAQVAQARDLTVKVPSTGERRLVVVARLLSPRALPQTRTAGFPLNARTEAPRSLDPLKEPVFTLPPRSPRGR